MQHRKRKPTWEQRIDRATMGLFRVFRSQVKPVNPGSLEKILRQHRGASNTTMADVFNRMMELQHDREHLYREYEEIIEDPAVANALELMTDDALPFTQDRGRSVWIEAKDDSLSKELNKRLSELGIENNIWDWAYSMASHGDFFVGLDHEEGKGVVSVDDSIHPIDVDRVDVNGRLVAYRDKTEQEGEQFKNPFDFVHFRIMGAYVRRRQDRFGSVRRVSEDGKRFRMTTKYGVSVMANARKPWRQLTLVENTMILNRIQRSPRTLFKLRLSDPDPQLAADYTELYEEKLLKNRNLDITQDRLNSLPNDLAMGQDSVVPVSDAVDVEVEEIGKNIEVRGIADVEYLRNKFYGSLKVPQAFLGFEDSLPGGLGENSIFYISTRYARTVKRIQRALCDGIKKILIIDYMIRHPNKILNPDQFKVTLDITSTAEELERRQAMQLIAETVKTISELAEELGVKAGLEGEALYRWALDRLLPGLERTQFFDERKSKKAKKEMDDQIEPGEEDPQDKPDDGEIETDALDRDDRSANPVKKPPTPPQSVDDRAEQYARMNIRQNLVEWSPPPDPDLAFLCQERQKAITEAKTAKEGDAVKTVAWLNSEKFADLEKTKGKEIIEKMDAAKKKADAEESEKGGKEAAVAGEGRDA